jgi:hypothetical protein
VVGPLLVTARVQYRYDDERTKEAAQGAGNLGRERQRPLLRNIVVDHDDERSWLRLRDLLAFRFAFFGGILGMDW